MIALAVLAKDGEGWLPKKDVLPGITELEFLFDLLIEVVVGVFGFPKAMRQSILINEGAVDPKRMTVVSFDLPFGNELPTKLPAAMLKQSLKCRADCAFMRDADRFELTPRFIIILHRLVSRFEV